MRAISVVVRSSARPHPRFSRRPRMTRCRWRGQMANASATSRSRRALQQLAPRQRGRAGGAATRHRVAESEVADIDRQGHSAPSSVGDSGAPANQERAPDRHGCAVACSTIGSPLRSEGKIRHRDLLASGAARGKGGVRADVYEPNKEASPVIAAATNATAAGVITISVTMRRHSP